MYMQLSLINQPLLTIESFHVKVGIDLIGPLPETKAGNQYIITLVDYFSKWPEAEALLIKEPKL